MLKNSSEIPLLQLDRNGSDETKENLFGNMLFKGNVLERTQLLTMYKLQSYTKGKKQKAQLSRSAIIKK